MRRRSILCFIITIALLLSLSLGFAADTEGQEDPSVPASGPVSDEPIADESLRAEENTAESEVPTEPEANLGIPVLMYHHLLPESMMADLPYNAAIISFESFHAQMKWLKNEGWTTLTLEDLHAALASDLPLPEKSFVVTFDDGYASNLFFAYPVLNRYNFTATEFVITANLEEETRKWEGKKLSWLDLQAISRIFSIQSHCHAFHQMEDGQAFLAVRTEEEIRKDLNFAWAEIDRHMAPGIRAFSYPYGVSSPAAIRVLKEQDVALAFTTEAGYLTKETDPLLIPRFGITPSVTMKDFQNIFGVKPPEAETGETAETSPAESPTRENPQTENPTSTVAEEEVDATDQTPEQQADQVTDPDETIDETIYE